MKRTTAPPFAARGDQSYLRGTSTSSTSAIGAGMKNGQAGIGGTSGG